MRERPRGVADLLDYLNDFGTAKCREVRTGRVGATGPWTLESLSPGATGRGELRPRGLGAPEGLTRV